MLPVLLLFLPSMTYIHRGIFLLFLPLFFYLHIDMVLTSIAVQVVHLPILLHGFENCNTHLWEHKQFNVNAGNNFVIFSAEWRMPMLLTLCENHKNEKSEKGRSLWVSQSFLVVPSNSVLKAENINKHCNLYLCISVTTVSNIDAYLNLDYS